MIRTAVSDTGPLRHLSEIGADHLLRLYAQISVPEPVVQELRDQGFWQELIGSLSDILTIVAPPAPTSPEHEVTERPKFAGSAADTAVLSLAVICQPAVVLTDDLTLRRAALEQGSAVTGSIGIIIRAYREGVLAFDQMDRLLDRLFDDSTLYLSPDLLGRVKARLTCPPSDRQQRPA